MDRLAQTCERIAATTKKGEKIAILVEYFRACSLANASTSAIFLSGRAFPAFEERTLQVAGALLWKLVADLANADESAIRAAYRQHGDLGSAACELLVQQQANNPGVTLTQVRAAFNAIAEARGPAA